MQDSWLRIEGLTKIIDNVDYYKIYLTKSQTIYVNLSVPSLCDFDLYLYNSTYQLKDSSITIGLGGIENVSYTADEIGYYYIKVTMALLSPGGNYTIFFDVDG